MYLIVWCVYVPATYLWAYRNKLHMAGVTALHAAPAAVAIAMTYVFLISGGATVAQFAAGSDNGLGLWRSWLDLWPVLLIATGVSALVTFILSNVARAEPAHRKWLPLLIAALAMSVFAFFTVGFNFPDA